MTRALQNRVFMPLIDSNFGCGLVQQRRVCGCWGREEDSEHPCLFVCVFVFCLFTCVFLCVFFVFVFVYLCVGVCVCVCVCVCVSERERERGVSKSAGGRVLRGAKSQDGAHNYNF